MSSFIQINNVSKLYEDGDSKTYGLNNVSLSFFSSGLVGIVGVSGSGKSTLLNMLALIDKPSKGDIFINGQNIKKWKTKQINYYHNRQIGVLYQNFHLLEEETAIFNIMLPMMILGKSVKRCKEDALILLNNLNISKDIYNSKVCDLSGGEKARIAVIRAVINSPYILLADEPTGALDSENANAVMKLLHNISKNRLVIVVSHNQKLIKEYCDRLITIDEGRVVSDKEKRFSDNGLKIVKEKNKNRSTKWIDHMILSNIKQRKKINLFSILAVIFSLTFSILVTGFTSASKDSISNRKYDHFDYGVATISKETIQEKTSGGITIIRSFRPSYDEIVNMPQISNSFYIEPNYDYVFPSNAPFKYSDNVYESFSFSPIYDFGNLSCNKSLLLNGSIPKNNGIEKCLINKKAYDILKKEEDPLHKNIELNYTTFIVSNNNESRLEDEITLSLTFEIFGVVDEVDFLSIPHIYYSYIGLDEVLENIILQNHSSSYLRDISVKDAIRISKDTEDISSFSYRLFAKNYKEIDYDKILIDEEYNLTSNAKSIQEALEGLVDVSTSGMSIFVIIMIVGAVLIIGMISYYSLCLDRKKIAIIRSLGASNDDVFSIYFIEALLIGVIGLVISSILSVAFSFLFNVIIFNTTGFKQMIKIPWISWLGIHFLFPYLLVSCVLVIMALATMFPMISNAKVDLRYSLLER